MPSRNEKSVNMGTGGTILATGFFDGVHLGHRRIIDGADSVLTFLNHPFSVLCPGNVPPLLMTAEERLEELSVGGREVRAPEFTTDFAEMSPEDFISFLQREYPRLEKVRCGANWTFGAGGRGDPGMLRAAGMDVEVVDYEMFCGEPVSSTRIRCELSAGRIARANAMLGRAFTFSGTVCSGKGVGGAMGFPTLNLKPGKPLFLPFGVYVVQTEFGLAVANWGMAPTMAESAWEEPVFEVHLLDASQLPVGKDVRKMKSQLLAFLRPEKKFDTVEDLLRQIAKDVDAALKFEQSDK